MNTSLPMVTPLSDGTSVRELNATAVTVGATYVLRDTAGNTFMAQIVELLPENKAAVYCVPSGPPRIASLAGCQTCEYQHPPISPNGRRLVNELMGLGTTPQLCVGMHIRLPVPMRLINTAPYSELRAFRDGKVDLRKWIQPAQRSDREPIEWTIVRTGESLCFKPPPLSTEKSVYGGVGRFCKKFNTEIASVHVAQIDYIGLMEDTITITVVDPMAEGKDINLSYKEVQGVASIVSQPPCADNSVTHANEAVDEERTEGEEGEEGEEASMTPAEIRVAERNGVQVLLGNVEKLKMRAGIETERLKHKLAGEFAVQCTSEFTSLDEWTSAKVITASPPS